MINSKNTIQNLNACDVEHVCGGMKQQAQIRQTVRVVGIMGAIFFGVAMVAGAVISAVFGDNDKKCD